MRAKLIADLLFLAYMLLALLGGLVALGFLAYAETWPGRVAALAGLALLLLPLAVYRARRSAGRRARTWLAAGLALFALGATGALFLAAPSGQAGPAAPVSQHFTSGIRFPRYALTNVVPEREQVNLGFLVTPWLDPYLTRAQARRVSAFTLDLYREMDADPDFRRLGSAMGWAYADLLGRPYDVGHYYLYVPRNGAGQARPAILFLHGSFGNFKAYTWVWSKLAEEQGYVVVAPSFGFGDWGRPGGARAALAALEDAARRVEIDRERVYLAGLSNGGLGVSHLAAQQPARFRGLIWLSPVMDTGLVDGEVFQAAWTGRPMLVVTGAEDRRIPVEYVERRVARLKAGGVAVEYARYPGEDHFLFFSQRQNVLACVAAWLAGVEE